MKSQIHDFQIAEKTTHEHFPNGVVEFDDAIFTDLFDEADKIEIAINDVISAIKRGKEEKTPVDNFKAELNSLRKQQRENELSIKQVTKENALYIRAVKPYINAKKCVEKYENYKGLKI